MRFIRNHRKALALGGDQLAHFLQRMGEGLDGADHNLLPASKGRGQLRAFRRAITGDDFHHALGAFKTLDGFA